MTIDPPTPYTGPITQRDVDAAFPRRAQSLGSLLRHVSITQMDHANETTSIVVGPCILEHAMAIEAALKDERKKAANDGGEGRL